MPRPTLTAAVLALLTCAPAFAQAPRSPSPQALEFFETKVRPVLAEHCFSCHGPKKQMGGLRLDTGEFGPWHTTAFVSGSYSSYDKFKGPGYLKKQQFNAVVYQDMGDLGWIQLAMHWNSNRNNFYNNPTFYPTTSTLTTVNGVQTGTVAATAAAEASREPAARSPMRESGSLVCCARPIAASPGARRDRIMGSCSAWLRRNLRRYLPRNVDGGGVCLVATHTKDCDLHAVVSIGRGEFDDAVFHETHSIRPGRTGHAVPGAGGQRVVRRAA